MLILLNYLNFLQETRVFIKRSLIKTQGLRKNSDKQYLWILVSSKANVTDKEGKIEINFSDVSELLEWLVQQMNTNGNHSQQQHRDHRVSHLRRIFYATTNRARENLRSWRGSVTSRMIIFISTSFCKFQNGKFWNRGIFQPLPDPHFHNFRDSNSEDRLASFMLVRAADRQISRFFKLWKGRSGVSLDTQHQLGHPEQWDTDSLG